MFVDFREVLAVVKNFAVFDYGVYGGNTHYRLGSNRFTRTGLAHDGERFALVKIERYIPYRLHFTVLSAER